MAQHTLQQEQLACPVIPLEALGAEHLFNLVITSGEVSGIHAPKLRLERAMFECRRCGAHLEQTQSAPDQYEIPTKSCSCGNADFDLDPEASTWVNYQELSLTEHGLATERPRRRLRCRVEGNLVGKFQEGAFVSVTARPVPGEQIYTTFDLVLELLAIVDAETNVDKHTRVV